MNQQIIEKNQAKLEFEKTRLEKMLARFAHRHDSGGKENFDSDYPNIGDDMDANAAEVTMYETNLGEEKSLESRLSKVNAALAGIKNGTYGRCSVGGEEIEEARLSVAPEADTCVKHSS